MKLAIDNVLKKTPLSFFAGDSFPKFRRVFVGYILPSWGNLLSGLTFMGLFAAMEAASVKILEPIFNEVFIDKNRAALSIIGLQVLVLFALKGVASYFQAVLMAKVGIRMVRKMQNDLFAKVVRQDLAFFHRTHSGDLLIPFTNSLDAIRESMINGMTSLFKDSLTAAALIALMFWRCPRMACVMFIVFPIGIYPVVYFGKKARKIFSTQMLSFGALYTQLSQIFRGMRVVKSYCLEEEQGRKVAENARDISKMATKMVKLSNLSSPVMEFLGGVAIAGSLFYGGMLIVEGKLTTGAFMVFLLAIVAAYKPMRNLANLNVKVQMGAIAMDLVFDLLDTPPKIRDKENAKPLHIYSGRVIFRNVVFGYDEKTPILHSVSLEAKPGQKVALVGLAGSGKSTVVNLLQRFYDVQSGTISIDGEDVKDVTLDSLRSQIAYVCQDVVIFNGTIEENIRMGNPKATEEEVVLAAKRAGAHDFITGKDKGYKTSVGEEGSSLSGGQKQMISIARAMLKNAPILVLDEATSSLDSKSEQMVQQGLSQLAKNRTSFVIAHRLSTIRDADMICVMEGGRLVEQGSHNQLLEKNGRYAKLYAIQYGSEEQDAKESLVVS